MDASNIDRTQLWLPWSIGRRWWTRKPAHHAWSAGRPDAETGTVFPPRLSMPLQDYYALASR